MQGHVHRRGTEGIEEAQRGQKIGEIHVKMEAETAVMQLPVKECLDPPLTRRSKVVSSTRAFRGSPVQPVS